jgi:hypothetical protein
VVSRREAVASPWKMQLGVSALIGLDYEHGILSRIAPHQDFDDVERPVSAERDRVSSAPVRHRCLRMG